MDANPNTLSAADFPEFWSSRMQAKHYKIDRYRDFVNSEEHAVLEKGDKVTRPYRSALVAKAMGADGSYSRQAITDTEEHLTIDVEEEVSFYIKKLDEIQSNYKTADLYAGDAAKALSNLIDGRVFAEVANATSTVDDGDIDNGTDGNGITMDESNVLKIIAKAAEKLDLQEVEQDSRRAAISPQFKRILKLALQGRDTSVGDKVGVRGRIGAWDGFDLNLSTALYQTVRLAMATNPTDGDTIVLNGVTLTFKDTLGTTAGNVHICSSAAKTLDNLLTLLETPETSIDEDTDAGWVTVSAANLALLGDIDCTDGGTYLDIAFMGRGHVAVSETLSAAADEFTPEKQILHHLFCRGQVNKKGKGSGPIDIAIQVKPNMETFHRDGYVGRDVVSWTALGLKTFAEGAAEMCDVQIKTSTW